MKKIMFNDRYGLTQAVIDGRKTMTRRIVPQTVVDYCTYDEDTIMVDAAIQKARYKVGEIVAVAQAYRDIDEFKPKSYKFALGCDAIYPFPSICESAGWLNKMFVRPDLMPIKIRITDVKVERLQDISDEDCLKEGIDYIGGYSDSYYFGHGVNNIRLGNSPREAFADLIDKVSGKGTWKANPWVFAYSFELVK